MLTKYEYSRDRLKGLISSGCAGTQEAYRMAEAVVSLSEDAWGQFVLAWYEAEDAASTGDAMAAGRAAGYISEAVKVVGRERVAAWASEMDLCGATVDPSMILSGRFGDAVRYDLIECVVKPINSFDPSRLRLHERKAYDRLVGAVSGLPKDPDMEAVWMRHCDILDAALTTLGREMCESILPGIVESNPFA